MFLTRQQQWVLLTALLLMLTGLVAKSVHTASKTAPVPVQSR